jgi:S-adenosylhomocysteine hydrolase
MLTSEFKVCTVLRELAEDFFSKSKSRATFENVLLVGVQHILETTVDMLSVMKEYGLQDGIIGGKKYSTHVESAKKIEDLGFTVIEDGHQLGYGRFDDCMQEVVHKIWFKALEKMKSKKYDLLIILDDGADLLRATPGHLFNGVNSLNIKHKPAMVIGIEQTRGGTNHPLFSGLPFPIIDIAGSFVKEKTEYPRVAEIVALNIFELIHNQILKEIKSMPVIGIVGYGTMGKSVVRCLSQKSLSIIIYDNKKSKRDDLDNVTYYDNLAVMIANADIIIGCTGKDITKKKSALASLLYSKRKKWLISTGSKDHEFNNLLTTIQNETKSLGYIPDPFKNIFYENHVGESLEIIRGGFPVNFNNKAHSVLPVYIWPTRAAIMLACFSAVHMHHHHFKHYLKNINIFMLPTDVQLAILKKYCELNSHEQELSTLCKENRQKIFNFIEKNSDGLRLTINSKNGLKAFSGN